MSERGTAPRQSIIYRQMSIHGEMPIRIYNAAVRRFNGFYKQPITLGTIPETTENANMTVAEVSRNPKQSNAK